MKRMFSLAMVLTLLLAVVGCKKATDAATSSSDQPTFILGTSEYPSSSMFIVAKQQGVFQSLAKKWNIKVELKETDYDTLITMYGSNKADAVCITNMDTLAPSLSRKGVAVLPVSTSFGGDAVVVDDSIKSISDLKNQKSFGLQQSVSQYLFERGLEIKGLNPSDYPFANMDPAEAATAFETSQKKIDSIVVWNPFIMQCLATRANSRVLFDSTIIPEEIVDVVFAGKDSLSKPGGDRFGAFICDVFYTMNRKLIDPVTSKDTTVALGSKFSNLNYDQMKQTLKATLFYSTPQESEKLLASDKFRNEITPRVVKWSVDHKLVPNAPKVGFDDESADVNYPTKYINMVK